MMDNHTNFSYIDQVAAVATFFLTLGNGVALAHPDTGHP
jgi:hypothetical protein